MRPGLGTVLRTLGAGSGGGTWPTDAQVKKGVTFLVGAVTHTGTLVVPAAVAGLDIPGALQQLLVATPGVPAALGTYDFGAGAEPAVFTVDPAPKDATSPLVVITQEGGQPWGPRGHKGAEVSLDVRVWGDRDRSQAPLRVAAWKVWNALERADLAFVGWDEVGCYADPPTAMTDDEGFPGFSIRVLVRVMKE